MLQLPGSVAQFLDRHWQKSPLFLPQAVERLRPAVSRNELAWLATLDDVESRLVFTDRGGGRVRYRAESGPFDAGYLVGLPRRDWTLLVHDVEKHLPTMRRLFDYVPFIPDWRIDDLMVSFAAPGGGVGPHRDNYDVFLCQGIGGREWHVAPGHVADDPAASDDLALTAPFEGQVHTAREGDVLYLPPSVAHWGTATRACITYSIGMRAPQRSDLLAGLPDSSQENPFYIDPDLAPGESVPGCIAPAAIERAMRLVGMTNGDRHRIAETLGRYVTQPKDWIAPDKADSAEAAGVVHALTRGLTLRVHGMARIAWDDRNLYVNGACRPRSGTDSSWLESICARRSVSGTRSLSPELLDCLKWMLQEGAFELPENP